MSRRQIVQDALIASYGKEAVAFADRVLPAAAKEEAPLVELAVRAAAARAFYKLDDGKAAERLHRARDLTLRCCLESVPVAREPNGRRMPDFRVHSSRLLDGILDHAEREGQPSAPVVALAHWVRLSVRVTLKYLRALQEHRIVAEDQRWGWRIVWPRVEELANRPRGKRLAQAFREVWAENEREAATKNPSRQPV